MIVENIHIVLGIIEMKLLFILGPDLEEVTVELNTYLFVRLCTE